MFTEKQKQVRNMNETDKVVIALGFFTLVGFLAYLYFLRTTPATATAEFTLADLKKAKENWAVVRR